MIDKKRKKELLLKYKEMKPDMGVYMIKSLNTGKVYLGYDKDLMQVVIKIRNFRKNGLKLQKKALKLKSLKYWSTIRMNQKQITQKI